MRRRAQHLSYRTAFNYSTKVHYCNSISNLGDNAKVVSDEEDAEADNFAAERGFFKLSLLYLFAHFGAILVEAGLDRAGVALSLGGLL